GAEVHFLTAVGNDQWGKDLLNQLSVLGVNTADCLRSPSQLTSSYVAIYKADSQMWVAYDDMSVMRAITPGYVYRLRRLVRETDMICMDANIVPETMQTLMRLAKEYGIPVVVDPTAALLAHRFQPYLSQLTVVTPDKAEAEALLGKTLNTQYAIGEGARELVRAGVDLAIITLGADGSFYATSDESGRLPALPVTVVDPTGAGDALTAAVAFGLLNGISPGESARLGMAAASLTLSCRHTVCPTLSLESLYERLVM
ncbi:MAG: PfkB family carbohydrate kinase, partial [Anaerolineae bacterium]|nr:PfkB family carbohydrate kinase [Anaerolineae bacterium]